MSAITTSTLTADGTTTDATSFATASVTPTANEVVAILIKNTKSSGVGAPSSVTGNGITYTKASEKVSGSQAVSLWVGSSGSPSAGAITIDYGANTQTACTWDVEQTVGASLTSPVRQSATGNGTSTSAALSGALSAFQDSDSLGLYIVSHAANEATTPAASWSEIQDKALGSPSTATETASISGGGALNPAPSWSTSSAYVILAAEIAKDPPGGAVVAFVA